MDLKIFLRSTVHRREAGAAPSFPDVPHVQREGTATVLLKQWLSSTATTALLGVCTKSATPGQTILDLLTGTQKKKDVKPPQSRTVLPLHRHRAGGLQKAVAKTSAQTGGTSVRHRQGPRRESHCERGRAGSCRVGGRWGWLRMAKPRMSL